MVKKIFNSSFGIQGEAVDKLIDDVARKTLEIVTSFDIPPGSMRPFSQIMQEANAWPTRAYILPSRVDETRCTP